jgi:hypothetical protein
MDWWLTGKKLNTNEPVVTLDELEGRLFRRPELWWIFSATEPKKHYLATCKNKDTYRYGQTKCQAEDTGLYLARLGLLSDAEKKYDYKPYVNQEPDWKVEEVSPDHTASTQSGRSVKLLFFTK